MKDSGNKDGGIERLQKQGTDKALCTDHNPNGLGGETCNLKAPAVSYNARAKPASDHPRMQSGKGKK